MDWFSSCWCCSSFDLCLITLVQATIPRPSPYKLSLCMSLCRVCFGFVVGFKKRMTSYQARTMGLHHWDILDTSFDQPGKPCVCHGWHVLLWFSFRHHSSHLLFASFSHLNHIPCFHYTLCVPSLSALELLLRPSTIIFSFLVFPLLGATIMLHFLILLLAFTIYKSHSYNTLAIHVYILSKDHTFS